MVSLPEGLWSPNSTSATALPPSVPGNQASSRALACSCSHSSASGRPFISTSTSGLPVALSALISSRWVSGTLMRARLEASWAMPWDSPTTATTTSAWRAVATASAISSLALRGSTATAGS